MAEQFIKVTEAQDLRPGDMRLVEVEGQRIVVANVAGAFYAFDDGCTHAEGPLSEGMLEDDRVECPWHGSVFDVRSGRPLRGPARDPVHTYAVRVEAGSIMLALPQA